MSRNYSLPTVKALFGEASSCAFPDCGAPLVFRDRGQITIVAQIAHIRSEQQGGPRYDAAYPADLIDQHENLLLLCGTHHPPVDRHESLYPVSELLEWKRNQVAAADGGIGISDAEARRFARLSEEEKQAVAQVARLARRSSIAAERAQRAIDQVDAALRAATRQAQLRIGPVYEADEKGGRTGISHRLRLPEVEQRTFREARDDAVASGQQSTEAAVEVLAEELAVLQMMGGEGLSTAARRVGLVALGLIHSVGDGGLVSAQQEALDTAVERLWSAANGAE